MTERGGSLAVQTCGLRLFHRAIRAETLSEAAEITFLEQEKPCVSCRLTIYSFAVQIPHRSESPFDAGLRTLKVFRRLLHWEQA